LINLLEKGQKHIFALRNYQEAFSKLVEVMDVYVCKPGRLIKNTATHYVWAKDKGRRIKSDSIDLKKLFLSHLFHDGQLYWFATIKSENGTYAVSVYSAVRSQYKTKVKNIDVGQGVVYVQIIENAEVALTGRAPYLGLKLRYRT
jgi:hypothetical protein